MTGKELKEFQMQYPDTVILERNEEETEKDVVVKYAAYGDDAKNVIEYTKAPFECSYGAAEDGLHGKVVFNSKFLENVVRGLTHNMKRVAFVSCNK